jgi:Kef-type K+ transport system membrane component KefB
MDQITQILLTLGGLFLIGLATDILGGKTPLPRVTFLLLTGFLIGPSGLDILPDFSENWFPILTHIALIMIGFLLGEKMTLAAFRQHGRIILSMSVGEVMATAGLMFIALYLLGVQWEIAILLAGIAPASAPAATVDVVHELNAKGKFTDTLLGIVAIDDAWGLLIFSVSLAAVEAVRGHGGSTDMLLRGAWEIGGAFLVGIVLGIPMAYLTGRIRDGEPTQAEALGLVFLCGGIAVWLEVSYILSAMVLGSVVANLASHHNRPFHAIEGIEWPFMILFFVLAGASLHLNALLKAGALGAAYVGLRVVGLYIGARLAGRLSHAPGFVKRWMGLTLVPQAGVALGMALIATQHFPDLKQTILPVVIGSTVVFEVIGPTITRRVIVHIGEHQQSESE